MMKHKKILWGLFVLFFLIIGVFHFNVNNTYIETQMSIYVKSLSGEDGLIMDTDVSESQFYFDISYLTNKDQNYNLYLLDNFEPVSFSLNDGEYKEHYEIELQTSDTPLITKDNLITINDIKYQNNDICLLLTSENFIFTKRFQLNYIDGIPNPIYKELKACPLNEPLDKMSIMDESLKIDIEYLLSQSHFYSEFINSGPKTIHYSALILENGKITASSAPFAFTTDEARFEVPIGNNLKRGKKCILIFPFANSFDLSFLGTYKALLWSTVIQTNYYDGG